MAEQDCLDDLTSLITRFAYPEVQRVFEYLYPTEEIGYVPPAEGAFFTADEAQTAHQIVHDVMGDFAKYRPKNQSCCVWTALRDKIEKFIEGIVGDPMAVLADTLDQDMDYIDKHVAEAIAARRHHILKAIGREELDTETLRKALIEVLWNEAYDLDQTVPASVLTDHDHLTMVFHFPRDPVSDDLTQNLGSGRGIADGLAKQWSAAGPGASPILAVTTRMKEVINVLPERQLSAVCIRGGGLIGYIRDGTLHAASLTDDFVLDPYALVPCEDSATRQVAADWLQSSPWAEILGPPQPSGIHA